jgi:hypothetical protein
MSVRLRLPGIVEGVERGGGAALLGEYSIIFQKGVLTDGPVHLYPWAFLSTSQRKPLAGDVE